MIKADAGTVEHLACSSFAYMPKDMHICSHVYILHMPYQRKGGRIKLHLLSGFYRHRNTYVYMSKHQMITIKP